MSATQKFFRFLFGEAGDRATVPDATAPDGSLSYQQGYGFDYQRAATDPNVKNIERDKLNQVLYDLTLGARQYQLHGFPEYVQSADNGGAALSYGAGAVVLWTDGYLYRSLKAANTDTPATAASWGRVALSRGRLTLTSASTWVVPDDVYAVWVSGCGGGGGGGGAAGNNGVAQQAGGGGGGGAGQPVIRQLVTVTPGQTLAAAIGAGGTLGAGGAAGVSTGANGGAGGSTTLSVQGGATLLTLTGGTGGAGGANLGSSTIGAGGGGGAGSPQGGAGDDGAAGAGGGAGASGPFGTGGARVRGSQGASAGSSSPFGFGSGGGGGGGTYAASTTAGGPGTAGKAGVLYLEW